MGVEVLLSAEAMDALLDSLADAVIQRHGTCDSVALVGIQRRGVSLASRLGVKLEKKLGRPVPMGVLDITLYRDDWTTIAAKPAVAQTSIPFDVEFKTLILVDDVLYTGRTIRAALEALADFGRPQTVELLSLVDRGHRELPIHADYVGLRVLTAKEDRVDVLMTEYDACDEVRLVRKQKA